MLTLVTGVGARGQVGEAVAAALLAHGETVLIVARTPAESEARARELAESVRAGRVHGYACDLTDGAQVDHLAARVRDEHGDRLDALVNLAGGFGLSGPIAESDPSVLDRMMAINFRTSYLATRAFLPALRRARGAIVYFASEAVLQGSRTRELSAYVAAKSAVVGLMRSVADEGAAYGVRANALAPAAIRTATNEADMGQQARYVERDEVAATVSFLCSPGATGVTGQLIRLSA